MNITHEGKTYEVLTLDRISEITHAKTGSGAILSTRSIDGFHHVYTDCENWEAVTTFCDGEFEIFGIHPLKLIERNPGSFVWKIVGCQHKPEFETVWLTIEVSDGVLLPEYFSLVKVAGRKDYPN